MTLSAFLEGPGHSSKWSKERRRKGQRSKNFESSFVTLTALCHFVSLQERGRVIIKSNNSAVQLQRRCTSSSSSDSKQCPLSLLCEVGTSGAISETLSLFIQELILKFLYCIKFRLLKNIHLSSSKSSEVLSTIYKELQRNTMACPKKSQSDRTPARA